MTTRGFTLIELLVVIAIIGILSSVVLASINTARTKALDASVLADMDSLAAQTAMYYDDRGTYGDTAGASDCATGVFADANVQNIFAAIATHNNGGASLCYASGDDYAAAVERPSGNGFTPDTPYWCVDNTHRRCGVANPIAGPSCNCT